MKVSVVTVAWNAAATIADTMNSVAAQTHEDLEHLVIDGASTDDTLAIVRSLATKRTCIVSEPDRGLYDAMNKGIAAARGDVIGFLNADDFYCRTDAVALIARAAPGADAVSASIAVVAARNPARLRRAYPSMPFAPWMLRFGHMPPHPGFYASRAAVAAVGSFDPSFRVSADFEWMVRFFMVNDLRATPLRETIVSLRDGGVSNRGFGSNRKINADALAALRRHGVTTAPLVVWSKYAMKALQMGVKPHQWPAPPPVRWPRAPLQSA